MRVRLYLDIELFDGGLPGLQEAIHDQPAVLIEMPQPFGVTGARLMGAKPVELQDRVDVAQGPGPRLAHEPYDGH